MSLSAEQNFQSTPINPVSSVVPQTLQGGAVLPRCGIKEINAELESLTAVERISSILERFGDNAAVLTSGGIQSRVLPTIISTLRDSARGVAAKASSRIPYLFIDTGDLFEESIRYAQQTTEELELTTVRLAHDLTPGEFKLAMSAAQADGLNGHDAFDLLTKVRVLQAALENFAVLQLPEIKLLIAGNRREQSATRSSLQFIEEKNGVLYLYPLADWSALEVRQLTQEHSIPEHPLARRGYRSVGNRSDTTIPPEDTSYEKDGRHGGVKTECGLHLDWTVARGTHPYGVRIIRDWAERVRSPR